MQPQPASLVSVMRDSSVDSGVKPERYENQKREATSDSRAARPLPLPPLSTAGAASCEWLVEADMATGW